MTAELLKQARVLGYEVTLGEAWRSQQTASFRVMMNAKKGIGIARSLHMDRLAIDLNLFRNGKYLNKTEDYRLLGEWWEAQQRVGIQFCWGGRFKMRDGNHFSFEHEGRK